MADKVIGAECRFVVHVPTFSSSTPDVHLIKEQIWKENEKGEKYKVPNLRIVENYKRPVWITKQNKRSHQQKKEWESEDNLLKSVSTESGLRAEIARLLNKQWSKESIRDLCTSPYIYGSDISSAVFIKQAYREKYKDLISPFSVCTFDVETDVINGTGDVIIASAAFKDKIIITILKDFIKGYANPLELLEKAANKYIKSTLDKHNSKIEFVIADTTVQCITECFKRIHKWSPDFLAIWNMDFDIPKVLEVLEKYNIDPKNVLCDPSLPYEYRICKYKKGPTKKVTSSGKVQPIDRAEQWHTFINTSSFYVIDAMCSYRHLRLSEQKKDSYSLDAILDEELNLSKLKFKEAEGYFDLSLHIFLQTNYPIEYCIYNIFDSLSMFELEYKTNDLASKIPDFSGSSEFSSFRSQPKRILDSFFFERLKEGYVLGTVGSNREAKKTEDNVDEDFDITADDEEEENDETLSLKDWIVTLPSHLMIYGLPVIEEDNGLRSLFRCFSYDSDSVSAYPTVTSCTNLSKETTRTEIIDIKGVDETVFRLQNLNIVQGSTNALEYCTTMFKMPKPYEFLNLL